MTNRPELNNGGGRVLLLSPADLSTALGGRSMLGRIHLLLLRDLLGNQLIHVRPKSSASPRREVFRGYIDGVNTRLITDLLAIIDEGAVEQMFVDGSNFGAAVAAIKRFAPRVRIITFFHNVEARFFWGSLRTRWTLKALAVLIANYLAERQAVRWSDVLVTLSERDSEGLKRLYGRGADVISPIALEDKVSSSPPPAAGSKPYLLFVGGGFYGNIQGLRWFAREVAPKIDIEVKVVGRGLGQSGVASAAALNVEVVGAVDDLAPWYAGALAVVAPILDGSGMKTKVAEALMFGKHVVGTPEAFSGYASDVVGANDCCIDGPEFVAAIHRATVASRRGYDVAMRRFYERDHSPAAATRRLAAVLKI